MRLNDWPQRLAEYLDRHTETPFAWGSHDCCRFAAGAVTAMTGIDPMSGFRYTTELGARRLILKAGSLEALLRGTLGDPLPSVAQARRGDVVLAMFEKGPSVGVVCGRVAAFAAPAGLLFWPVGRAVAAWGIE